MKAKIKIKMRHIRIPAYQDFQKISCIVKQLHDKATPAEWRRSKVYEITGIRNIINL